MSNTTYEQLAEAVNAASILGPPKLRVMHSLLAEVLRIGVPGASAEVGCYRGGTSLLIASMLPDAKLYVYDTFTGLPASGIYDTHQIGDFGDTELNAVLEVLKSQQHHIEMCVGNFPDTAQHVPDQKYAFVHCDGDQYQVTVDFLDYFYHRMSVGGVMVFDDYYWPHCPGVAMAVNEFFIGKENVQVRQEFQAFIIKE